MKRALLIIFFLACMIHIQDSQAQVAIVNDPVHTAITSSIEALNTAANSISTFSAELKKMEFATNAFDQIQSVHSIAKLLDDLVCLTSEFRSLMDLSEDFSCANFLDFQLVTFNLSYTSDILTKVLLAKNIFTMTSSDRLRNLETIRKTLETTIKEIQAINLMLRKAANKVVLSNYIKKNYYSTSLMWN